MDFERLISHPLSVVAGKHLHFEGFALCFVCHLMPVIFVRLYLVTCNYQLLTVNGVARHHLVGWLVHLKGQRCDIDRDCHIRIVRIDVRQ